MRKIKLFKYLGIGIGALALGMGTVLGINAIRNNNSNYDNGLVVSPSTSSGIKLSTTTLSDTSNTVSVTATVGPTTAIDKTVSWTLAWGGSSSATVTDYVSITPSSDTLTCTVAVKKAFTTQIILTCTANSNSSAKATCTIDYVDRSFEPSYNDGEADIAGENPYDYTFMGLFENAFSSFGDVSNLGFYTTRGGTLRGTVKNIEFGDVYHHDFFQEGIDANTNFGDHLYEVLSSGDYTYDEYQEIAQGDSNSWYYLEVYADIYYGDKLIAENVSTVLELVIYNIAFGYFDAQSVNLNNSQIIY